MSVVSSDFSEWLDNSSEQLDWLSGAGDTLKQSYRRDAASSYPVLLEFFAESREATKIIDSGESLRSYIRETLGVSKGAVRELGKLPHDLIINFSNRMCCGKQLFFELLPYLDRNSMPAYSEVDDFITTVLHALNMYLDFKDIKGGNQKNQDVVDQTAKYILGAWQVGHRHNNKYPWSGFAAKYSKGLKITTDIMDSLNSLARINSIDEVIRVPMTLVQLYNFNMRWRKVEPYFKEYVHAYLFENYDIDFSVWPALFEEKVVVHEITFYCLASHEQLLKEAEEMGNCASTYRYDCLFRKSHIISCCGKGARSTIELCLNRDGDRYRLSLEEIRGEKNSKALCAHHKAVDGLIGRLEQSQERMALLYEGSEERKSRHSDLEESIRAEAEYYAWNKCHEGYSYADKKVGVLVSS